MQLEAAYDTVFMESMKARMSGQTNVSTSVRYADVPPEPPRRGPQSSQQVRVGESGETMYKVTGRFTLHGSRSTEARRVTGRLTEARREIIFSIHINMSICDNRTIRYVL